jgi:SAM-dependent methyltransferase
MLPDNAASNMQGKDERATGTVAKKPDYGNWVPAKLIYAPGALGLVFLGLSFLLPVLMIVALLAFAVLAYFAYARYRFSSPGGDVQARIWDLVLGRLDWEGEGNLLDIGCGNAPLTIRAAKKYPRAHVVGIDYWGRAWEYSQSVCERNAELEGVEGRVSFRKSSASALPFEDGSFDAVVSNLVFHEVLDARDKREVVKEALRVVKKGGAFAFQDTFLERRLYGEIDDLLHAIRSWSIGSVTAEKTSDSSFIPAALRLPFMVGRIAIIYGRK